jgi:phosphatidylserine/phosphatidylglycerophosphate/cardiolipin synthase-like enzyme
VLARIALAVLLASATITGVVPNPTTDGDRGEFVTVRFDESTNTSGWYLGDGESTAPLPNRTLTGEVALSTEPDAVGNRTTLPVVGLDGSLSLSNGGEWVRLRAGDRTAANVTYPDAPEAELWNGESWTPLGASDFAAFAAQHVNVTSFVLPDAPGPPLELLRSAEDRLYLAGYTLTSRRATATLAAAAARGVDVRVLVDGGPVGGMPRSEAVRLDTLVDAGVRVRVLDGDRTRYSFHHAKYAVADDHATVLTENWKPAGTGGHGSRGWGVTVRDDRVADHLARVFEADASWASAKRWPAVRPNVTLVDDDPADGSFPTRFRPVTETAGRVEVLVAPDNARSGVREFVRSAEDSLLVQQVSVDPESAFLNWTVAAARRGVRVRVLLSGAWYAREANRNVTERLNSLAASENLDLAAKVAAPRSRYAKIHAKGAVVDGERALVGSLNWNDHALTENREVAVVVYSDRVATQFSRAFRADWRGGCRSASSVLSQPRRWRASRPHAESGSPASSHRCGALRRSSSSSASAIFSMSASRTASRIPGTNRIEPTTRWPPPETPAPGSSSFRSATISGMSRRTPSERRTAKSGPYPMVMTGSPVSSTFRS